MITTPEYAKLYHRGMIRLESRGMSRRERRWWLYAAATVAAVLILMLFAALP